MRLWCRRVVLLFLLVALFSHLVVAVGIGVNKGVITFPDVLQNGYAQETVLVTTDSAEPITGTYQFEGELAPWLRMEPNTTSFEFSRDKPYALTIIVEPPADARLAQYTGGVRVLTGEIARSGGGKIGTSTRAAFLIKLRVGVSGTERLACQLGGVHIADTEVGQPFDFSATIVNKGNVRIKPLFHILVYDQYQEELVANLTVPVRDEILPTVTKQFSTRVSHTLQPGQYWATVELPLCGKKAFLTFDVLERGGIADKGELVRMESTSWAKTGDIIPIHAVFTNLGSRSVTAKLKGTITTRDGELVKVIDTDSYIVAPEETTKIETFFNPTAPGQYIVAGRVLYNDKLTFQKSTIINVRGPRMVASSSFSPLLLILFLLIFFFFFLILRKKRRARRRRVRR